MKTRNQAIKHAQKSVSLVHPVCQWSFAFRRFDERCNAWRESIPAPWYVAVANRSQALIDSAREFLALESVQYDGGAWTDYIPSTSLEVQIFTSEDGERFASVRCRKTGNGADFYASGQEVGWVDNNSLFLNCDSATVAHARKSAVEALQGKGAA
jgi:hypothetical protein